jgi:hypothetical protein
LDVSNHLPTFSSYSAKWRSVWREPAIQTFVIHCHVMTQGRAPSSASFQVVLMDMSHYADEESEITISGFPTKEEAIDYARRRVRDSIEELRKPNQSQTELRQLWFLFGEDALVPGDPAYHASNDLDDFLRHRATPEERNWSAIEKRLGNLIIKSSRQ